MIRVLVTEPGSMTVTAKTIDGSLETFQALVGGDIEHVTIAEDMGLYCNETGRVADPPAPQNEIASRLYWAARRLASSDQWDIRGVAVLVGPPDEEGNDTSLPDHLIQLLGNAPGVTLRVED